MDPFSALGFAANVVQFIDCAWRLVSETRAIAKSMDGCSEETRLLIDIIDDMEASNAALDNIASEDSNLRQIIRQCKTLSRTLMTILKTMTTDEDQSQWTSFRAALRGMWKKSEIESLFENVSRLRMRILEHLSTITV